MEIPSLQHPCDPKHALSPRELSDQCSFLCPLCRLWFNGPSYCCWACNIFLHKFCAELPLETEHPDHPHPLALSITGEVCNDGLTLHSYVYKCNNDSCSFQVDVSWKFLLPYAPKEDEEKKRPFQHLLHDHLLHPFQFRMPIKVDCRACELQIIGSSPFYGCSVCSFYIHETCAIQPVEIKAAPFHREQWHTLAAFLGESFYCNACCATKGSRSGFGFGYKCVECSSGECPFNLDIGCATLFLPSEQDSLNGTIEHFSHRHRLTSLFVKTDAIEILCRACDSTLSGNVYGCSDCQFFLHRSCVEELPQVMKHYLHPRHPLVFVAVIHGLPWRCSSCSNGIDCLAFTCNECHFYLHIACAVKTLSASKEGLPTKIKVPSTGSPKEFRSMKLKYFGCNFKKRGQREREEFSCQRERVEVGCHGCHKPLGLAYAGVLNFNNAGFCKSCGELPKKLKHPFHPCHPLKLMLRSDLYCDAVGVKIDGFCFGCDECKFYLSLQAASPKLSLNYQPHEHSLTHFDRIPGSKCCNFCGKSSCVDSYHCSQCDYAVHYGCVRMLPLSIKHDIHFHELVLLDKLVNEDHDLQYCDACETTRRPDRGVYYCAECPFAAHIGCVIPSVEIEQTAPVELKKLDREIAEIETDIEDARKSVEAILKKQVELGERLEKLKSRRGDLVRFLS